VRAASLGLSLLSRPAGGLCHTGFRYYDEIGNWRTPVKRKICQPPDSGNNPFWWVVTLESTQVPETAHAEELVRLLMKHQEDLFRYIFSLLPHEEDARDVLQETSVSLYRKFAEYDSEKPFLAWAYGFAYLEVLKQRERNERGTRHMKQELVELLSRERQEQETELHDRLAALENCLEQLPPMDRELIRLRYHSGSPVDDLIVQLGTSRRTFFRNLDRVRRALLECINRKLQVATH
jgi:RNA polymerase sigma-70 factor (ECF subfamily)